MDPKIVCLESIPLLGLQERFGVGEEDFEGIWKRFMGYHDRIAPLSEDGAYYGANFAAEGGNGTEYLAGMRVADVPSVPDGLTRREIPASLYAVFECTVGTISETYDRIFREWVGTAPYGRPDERSPKADFERYPPGTDSSATPVLLHLALEEQ